MRQLAMSGVKGGEKLNHNLGKRLDLGASISPNFGLGIPLRVMASGGQNVNHLDEEYDGEVGKGGKFRGNSILQLLTYLSKNLHFPPPFQSLSFYFSPFLASSYSYLNSFLFLSLIFPFLIRRSLTSWITPLFWWILLAAEPHWTFACLPRQAEMNRS